MERLANDCSSPRVTNVEYFKTRDGEEDELDLSDCFFRSWRDEQL